MLVSCPKVNHLGIKDTIHSLPQISYVSSNFTNAYIHRDIHHWTTIYKSKFKLLYIRKPCVNKPSLQNYMPLQRGLLCIPFEVSLLWSDSVYQIVPHLLTEEFWLRLRSTTTTAGIVNHLRNCNWYRINENFWGRNISSMCC